MLYDRALKILQDAGFGDYFIHGLGHGIGIDVHEKPFINHASRDILEAGMVITIEPGVYIQGLGGVRLEDVVLVTRTGHKVL
jgi:Xaa-Pro aminopeptidase